MVTSVYRLCINHLKHLQVESRYAERASRMLREAELFHSADDPLSELITKEECTNLEHAIAELPDQCRKIFELNKLEGLSYEEVSARLSISINTVRTQLTRGMRKLRERLT
jgi:RNA polymerase sigma-70 factor (ECF subfamily)